MRSSAAVAILVAAAATVAVVLRGAVVAPHEDARAPDVARPGDPPACGARVVAVSAFGRGPARFEPNLGQSPPSVRFVHRGPDHATLIEDSGFTTVVGPTHGRDGRRVDAGCAVAMRFVGSAARPQSRAEEELPGSTQYFVGRDESSWVRDVPNFARARFVAVWPGVDVVYHGADGNLEYDFLVAPGADAARIAFDVEGAERVDVDAAGDLVVEGAGAQFRNLRPRVVETGPRGAREVACGFALDGPSRVRLVLGDHDAASRLTIDPVLQVGVRAGGASDDRLAAVVAGPSSRIAMVGATTSVSFLPAAGPLSGPNSGQSDGFAATFTISTTATTSFYTAIVGSQGDECFTDAGYDPDGTLYAGGFTTDEGAFPAVHAPQTTHLGGQDGTIVAIDPLGTALGFAGAVGGGGDDLVTSVAVDAARTDTKANAVFVGLGTTSTDIPFAGTPAFASAPGGRDLAILRLTTGGVPTAGTYLGGTADDAVRGLYLVPTPDHGVAAAFSTTSPLTATPGAFQMTGAGTLNTFVVRLPPTMSAVSSSTFLGAGGADFGVSGMSTMPGGGFLVTGISTQGTIPTTTNAPTRTKPGQQDGFFYELTDDLRSAMLASYAGTSGTDDISGVAVTSRGDVFVAGTTYLGFQPTAGGQSKVGSGPDLWVASMQGSGGSFGFVSNIGSANVELGGGFGGDQFAAPLGRTVAVTSDGIVVVGGDTLATGQEYPFLGGTVGGGLDAFIQAAGTTPVDRFTPAFSTLKVTKGTLGLSSTPHADKFTVSTTFGGSSFGDVVVGGTGSLSFGVVALNSGSSVDTVVEDSIEFAATGWKAGKVLTFNGATQGGAHAKATVDLRRHTASIALTFFDAPFTPIHGPALFNFQLGEHQGSTVIQLKDVKPTNFTLLAPLTGVKGVLSFQPFTAPAGDTLSVSAGLSNYDSDAKAVTVQVVALKQELGSFSTTVPARDPITLLPGQGTVTFDEAFGRPGLQKLTLNLDGTRAAAATVKVTRPPPSQVVFSQTSFDFGTVPLGMDVSRPLFVTNDSAQPVTILVPALTGSWFIFPDLSVVIAAGEKKQFDFGFSTTKKGPVTISFDVLGPALAGGKVTIHGKATGN